MDEFTEVFRINNIPQMNFPTSTITDGIKSLYRDMCDFMRTMTDSDKDKDKDSEETERQTEERKEGAVGGFPLPLAQGHPIHHKFTHLSPVQIHRSYHQLIPNLPQYYQNQLMCCQK